MQNKSNLNINTGGHYDNALTSNQLIEEFSIENIPIHSMKKDLEMIKNPTLIRQESSPLPVSSNLKDASSSKISPFLEKTNLAPVISVSQKKPENTANESLIKQPLESKAPDSSRQAPLKKIFIFFIIFLSIAALGVGSYYFWLVRGENLEPSAEEAATTAPVSTPIKESPLPETIVESEIKPEKPKENAIILELENSTKLALKESLKNQIQKLTNLPLTTPLELKLQDSKNNSIPLRVFAEKTGITFVKDVSAYLGETIRLFVFNDGSQLGLGLIFESKNDTLLAKEILKKEPLLIENLDTILLEKFEKPTKISFNDNTYKNLSLRYFNIISPEKLSIDYAIAKNKLFFGTTRNTIYALYDLILSQPNSSF